jgi:hypothetical protein
MTVSWLLFGPCSIQEQPTNPSGVAAAILVVQSIVVCILQRACYNLHTTVFLTIDVVTQQSVVVISMGSYVAEQSTILLAGMFTIGSILLVLVAIPAGVLMIRNFGV